MKGVLRVATISGIPVQIHWSFSLLFFWVYYEGSKIGMLWDEILMFGFLIMSLFFCVVLHEFGHAFSARYYGVGTRDITLSPIGGIARLNQMPEKPIQEFMVALAGPLVNIAIAILIALGLWLFSPNFLPEGNSSMAETFSSRTNFFPILLGLNVIMAVFNLIPAFPMDGGRMLRSLLSMKLGRLKATRIASIVGRILAVAFLAYAIYNQDLIMGFISVFVFVMAWQEYRMVIMEGILDRKNLKELMRVDFSKFLYTDSVQQVVDTFVEGVEKNFLIFDDWGRQRGVLKRASILAAMQKKDFDSAIDKYITLAAAHLNSTDSLKVAYELMQNPDHLIIPVFEDGMMVGVLDQKVLDDYLRAEQRRG